MAKAVKSKSVLTNQSLQFLKNYINNPSPVGFESSGQKLWLNYIKPFVNTTMVDPYGTAVGVINPDASFKVVIEAHADEISWFVNYITPEGVIYLKRNGGVDHQIAPGQRVFIHGKKGPVKAVFGWPAIHTRINSPETQKNRNPKLIIFSLTQVPGQKKMWKPLACALALSLLTRMASMNLRMDITSDARSTTASAVI
jgi:hypothetical protein